MSDTWLRIIPDQPNFVPDQDQQQQALAYLRTVVVPDAEVHTSVKEQVDFLDCGVNFEGVSCPSCGAEIGIDVWQDWMDVDYDGRGFVLGEHMMPCCGARHTLHELRYDRAQGFGRFELIAMNPPIGELSKEQRDRLEQMLGCPVRVICRCL